MDKSAKIPCEICGKYISKNNMAVHKKKCVNKIANPTNEFMQQMLNIQKHEYEKLLDEKEKMLCKRINDLLIYQEDNKRLQTEIDLMRKNQLFAINNSQNAETINNTTNNNNINISNNYYVMDLDGNRSGLNMNKIRAFGDENIDYIDTSKPLLDILKQLYCNPDHLENKVISHAYLNLEWILFKYKDHILRLHLEHDRKNVSVLVRLICDNVQQRLGKEFKNHGERHDAVIQLLKEMDNDVNKLVWTLGTNDAKMHVPLWNKEQYDMHDDVVWRSWMNEPTYSHTQIDIARWEERGY